LERKINAQDQLNKLKRDRLQYAQFNLREAKRIREGQKHAFIVTSKIIGIEDDRDVDDDNDVDDEDDTGDLNPPKDRDELMADVVDNSNTDELEVTI